MKKVLSILLVLMLSLAMLAGCSNSGKTQDEATPTPPPLTGEGIVKLGIGQVTSIAKSKSLEGDAAPVGQVDTVMAAVGFDKDGKVAKVTIDTAQTKVNFDTSLQVTSDLTAKYKTKVELGDDYGMKKNSDIGKEWYEQIAELEKWMIGKTVDEIKSMKLKNGKPDIAELTSYVTVTVEDYINVVVEAYENAVNLQTSAETVGLGHVVTINKSKGAEGDAGPMAQVDNVMTAAAFDKEGKIAGVIIDNAQTKVNFDANGVLTSDVSDEQKTKVELGDAYGMKRNSGIGKEWYEQIAELEKWMVGKTIDEVKGMKVKAKDDAHPAVPDVAELTSLVTISVEGYLEAVADAFDNKK
jgi:uncharacterized protein YuzE